MVSTGFNQHAAGHDQMEPNQIPQDHREDLNESHSSFRFCACHNQLEDDLKISWQTREPAVLGRRMTAISHGLMAN